MKEYNLSGAVNSLANNPTFSKLVDGDNIQPVVSELVEKWESPSRFYHSIDNHLLPMIWKIKNMVIDERSRNLLEIIAWFHDCIYDPRSADNELNSIKFFNERLIKGHRANNEDANIIQATIGMTRDFKDTSDNIASHFANLDLDYFTRTDIRQAVQNELLVLKEFQFVDYSIYKQRRLKVLNEFVGNKLTSPMVVLQICRYLKSHRPRIGIYPGSFNPFHVGHLSILKEAEKLFDKVIVAEGINPEKASNPKIQSGLGGVKETLPYHQVEYFSTFLHEYVEKKSEDADITVIRGFRSGYDIDYELRNLAFMRDMSNNVKTVFIAPQKKFDHVSSSAIRLLKNFSDKQSSKYIPKPYYPS